MNRLEGFRNAPMHSRTLVPFEGALAEGMTGEIRNKVTSYRSELDLADRHFPRIEYVRDSFGNAPTRGSLTDIVISGLTSYHLHGYPFYFPRLSPNIPPAHITQPVYLR